MAEKGFTLFEVLVYIGLFSIIMSGVLLGAFQIMESSADARERVRLEQEAHFVFRKIYDTLNGRVFVTNPNRGDYGNFLVVDGNTFEVIDSTLVYNGEELTASAIRVTNFFVERTPNEEGDAVSVSFVLNGKKFATTTHYVR